MSAAPKISQSRQEIVFEPDEVVIRSKRGVVRGRSQHQVEAYEKHEAVRGEA